MARDRFREEKQQSEQVACGREGSEKPGDVCEGPLRVGVPYVHVMLGMNRYLLTPGEELTTDPRDDPPKSEEFIGPSYRSTLSDLQGTGHLGCAFTESPHPTRESPLPATVCSFCNFGEGTCPLLMS